MVVLVLVVRVVLVVSFAAALLVRVLAALALLVLVDLARVRGFVSLAGSSLLFNVRRFSCSSSDLLDLGVIITHL